MSEEDKNPYQEFGRERSHQDAKQTVETARALVQSVVLINGGAATAFLTFYGAHADLFHLNFLTFLAIAMYCSGLTFAAMAGFALMRSTQEFATYWELKSYPKTSEREQRLTIDFKVAVGWQKWFKVFVSFGIACFFIASLALSVPFLHKQKSKPGPIRASRSPESSVPGSPSPR